MQKSDKKSAVPTIIDISWYLFATPPFADIRLSNGDIHRTEAGGKNYFMPSGSEHCLPIIPCKFPKVALTLYLYAMIKKWGALVLLALFTINVIYAMMVYWAPQGAEVFQYSMLRIGHIVNLTLFAFACVVTFFVFVRLGSRTVSFNKQNWLGDSAPKVKVQQLSPQNWTPISIEPDILVYYTFTESQDLTNGQTAFTQRLEHAIQLAEPARWVVAVPFRSPNIMIYTGANEFIACGRAKPSFEMDDWPDMDRVCQHDTPFTIESYRQYMDYLDRFIPLYIEWEPMRKLSLDPDRAGRTFLENLQHKAQAAAATIIALLICVASVFGQKSAELKNYMGPTADETCPVGSVVIAFEKGRYPRKSDGTKSWVDVLGDVYLYDDDKGAGRVLSVEHTDPNGKKTVYKRVKPKPKPQSIQANTQPQEQTQAREKPKPNEQTQILEPIDPSEVETLSAPLPWYDDSTNIDQTFKEAEQSVLKMRSKLWRVAAPAWAFFMWLFGIAEPVIIMLMSLAWYYASTSANESAINMYGVPVVGSFIYGFHQGSSAALLIFTWIITTVTLINIFLWLVMLGWSLWLMLIVWLPVLWIARKLTNALVPNPNVLTPTDAHNQASVTPYRRLRANN